MKNDISYTIGLLSLLLGVSLLTIYLTDKYILTAGFYISNGDIFDESPVQEILIYQNLQKWIYFFSAVYLIIKVGVISILLSSALYLNDLKVSFRRIVNLVIVSELIFLIPAIVKIIHFYDIPGGINKASWNRFYFLSALQLFGEVPADWTLMFQSLNIFEISYWFLLALGIHRLSNLSYDRSLRIVLISYVPALCVWIVTVTFCSVMLFPQNG
ncbi:MAG TPA: hypothetical protein VGM63_10385 [Mucilaginibacter sp.]|jgi:hypothetical protein